MSEPTRSIETEQTYDVDAETGVPDWTQLVGVDSVRGPERRNLDAHYIDTATAELARHGVAVRRRTGGPDEGWHLKGAAVGDTRVELHWPLGSSIAAPDAVLSAVAPWSTEPLAPLARIQNERDAYLLRNSEGDVIAEFVDDHVIATDLRLGQRRAWREWEFELGPAAPDGDDARAELFAAARTIAYAAGARAAQSASKLARALGH